MQLPLRLQVTSTRIQAKVFQRGHKKKTPKLACQWVSWKSDLKPEPDDPCPAGGDRTSPWTGLNLCLRLGGRLGRARQAGDVGGTGGANQQSSLTLEDVCLNWSGGKRKGQLETSSRSHPSCQGLCVSQWALAAACAPQNQSCFISSKGPKSSTSNTLLPP